MFWGLYWDPPVYGNHQASADKDRATDYGHTALSLACNFCHAEVVRLLLQARADKETADCFGETALSKACDNGQAEIVKLLLDSGAVSEGMQ